MAHVAREKKRRKEIKEKEKKKISCESGEKEIIWEVFGCGR